MGLWRILSICLYVTRFFPSSSSLSLDWAMGVKLPPKTTLSIQAFLNANVFFVCAFSIKLENMYFLFSLYLFDYSHLLNKFQCVLYSKKKQNIIHYSDTFLTTSYAFRGKSTYNRKNAWKNKIKYQAIIYIIRVLRVHERVFEMKKKKKKKWLVWFKAPRGCDVLKTVSHIFEHAWTIQRKHCAMLK